GQVLTDLHAFFNDVETVGVGQSCALFHQRHNLFDDGGVLLVRSQVQNQISARNQFFVGANGEAVVSSVFPGLAFFSNRFLTQGVADVQAAVTHVQTLVQALCTATYDNNFFADQLVYAVRELGTVHKTALAQLLEL